MKKSWLAVFTLLLIGAVHAQSAFGAKAGLNVAKLSIDGVDSDARIGAYFGLFYMYNINEDFSIQPELIYSMQGAKSEERGSSGGVNYSLEGKAKLDYINLPILAKYRASEVFYFVAGPQIGFNISAKSEGSQTINNETVAYEEDIEDMNTDIGLVMGAGYSFMNNLGAELRYNIGLSDIADDADAKNSVAQFGLFYEF